VPNPKVREVEHSLGSTVKHRAHGRSAPILRAANPDRSTSLAPSGSNDPTIGYNRWPKLVD
jgi:hypothetical protein